MISEIFLTHLAHVLVSNEIHIINIAVTTIGLNCLFIFIYMCVSVCFYVLHVFELPSGSRRRH